MPDGVEKWGSVMDGREWGWVKAGWVGWAWASGGEGDGGEVISDKNKPRSYSGPNEPNIYVVEKGWSES